MELRAFVVTKLLKFHENSQMSRERDKLPLLFSPHCPSREKLQCEPILLVLLTLQLLCTSDPSYPRAWSYSSAAAHVVCSHSVIGESYGCCGMQGEGHVKELRFLFI